MLKDSPIVIKIANNLGLKRLPNAEMAIRNYCFRRVKRIVAAFGKIENLNQLLEVISSHLEMKFEEVHKDEDLELISRNYLKKKELIFSRLHKELDQKTDGLLIRLEHAKAWEPKFVAVIDCRGYKAWRAYFTKWHEISHLLTTPPTQMTFQFRRIPSFKKGAEEQIVDKVAGDIAFYADIFYPALVQKIARDGRLTFSAIESLRETVCVGASRVSTLYAAIRQIPTLQLLVIAGLGYKRDEERLLNSGQLDLFPEQKQKIIPKLRAVEVSGTQKAQSIGFRIHRNMQVPEKSVIYKMFENPELFGETTTEYENLSWWEHSKGHLQEEEIIVEARMSRDKVFALICKK